jgi:hypothetical protein
MVGEGDPTMKAENRREVIDLVHSLIAHGVYRVEPDGKIWRVAQRDRYGKVVRLKFERRAENVGGKGYLRLTLQMPGTKIIKSVMAHRVVWEHFNGPIDEKLQINHKDFDKQNNHPQNLEVVTQTENMQHSYAAGRERVRPWANKTTWRGKPRINNDPAKLAQIIQLRLAGLPLKKIVARTGVSLSHVQRICKGKG